jgi:hypothetical protein
MSQCSTSDGPARLIAPPDFDANKVADALDALQSILDSEARLWFSSPETYKTPKVIDACRHSVRTMHAGLAVGPAQLKQAWTQWPLDVSLLKKCFHATKDGSKERQQQAVALLHIVLASIE